MVSMSACPTVNKVTANFSTRPDASSPHPVTHLKIQPWGRRILSPWRCHRFVTGLCFFLHWRCLESGVQESSTQRMGQPLYCKWEHIREDKDLVLAVQKAPSGKEKANFFPLLVCKRGNRTAALLALHSTFTKSFCFPVPQVPTRQSIGRIKRGEWKRRGGEWPSSSKRHWGDSQTLIDLRAAGLHPFPSTIA